MVEGALNVRDLGGLAVGGGTTRPGVVYRSDALDWLTPRGEQTLFGSAGIGCVIDLRTHRESGGDGHADGRRFPGVQALSIPLVPDDRMDLDPFPLGSGLPVARHYLGYLDGPDSPAVRILTAIAQSVENGVPTLFHCAAGRDRTGVIAAALLLLLGVSERDVTNDYLQSNRNAVLLSSRLMTNPLYQRGPHKTQVTTYVKRRTMKRFIDLVHSQYGGAAGWARSSGVSPQTVDVLRANLVAADPGHALSQLSAGKKRSRVRLTEPQRADEAASSTDIVRSA